MFITKMLRLFTQPDQQWSSMVASPPSISKVYIQYLIPLTLIPALCLFVGTTETGWQITSQQSVQRLTKESGIFVSMGSFFSTIIGVYAMSLMILWMSATYEAKPNIKQCVLVTTHSMTPLFIFGIAGIYPQLWFLTLAALAAIAWSVYLLFTSIPRCMQISFEQGFVFSCSIICVGLVGLVTLFVISIVFLEHGLGPIYH